MTPCLYRCSLTRKLYQPAVGAAPLGIDPTPVPALNQTFAASAETRCHSRMAPALLTNARPGVLCVLYPTTLGTGAVKNATRRCHPSRTMLHREVKPAPEKRKRWRSRKPRKPGFRAPPQGAQPSTTYPVVSQHPCVAALGPSQRGPTPDGSQAKGPTAGQGSPDPPKPNPPSPGHKSAGQGHSSWATRVQQGPQVSDSGGAASPFLPSMIPQPQPQALSAPTWEQMEFRELQAQIDCLVNAGSGGACEGLILAYSDTLRAGTGGDG
ncbi:hypothetical protein HPB51_018926 [Rhipicephalus microplus]|uniref:Uncharacterized protein n=1 Tax=Rhipicephalus microplus TaxID=6941 RepID=A0A9J6DPW3_RHIMP|nr:hypothetical protein HPB51_018926 [Rhipicephalus microplus]